MNTYPALWLSITAEHTSRTGSIHVFVNRNHYHTYFNRHYSVKGRRIFTEDEVAQIRKLIQIKVLASTADQKPIRDRIRALKFYFSDYSKKRGYTVEDFDLLIKAGQIVVRKQGDSTFPEACQVEKKPKGLVDAHPSLQQKSIENRLLAVENFKNYGDLDSKVIYNYGFYCIKLKAKASLPKKYQAILNYRENKYLYIGKAETQSLRLRLGQEIEHNKPGAFFRSIGCVLGYSPIKGHLKGKANQNNFRIYPSDTFEIVNWLKRSVEISVVAYSGSFNLEKYLINKYNPLLNETHNSMKLQELTDDRARSRRIARG